MALSLFNKLQKFQIHSFTNAQRTDSPETFTAMFNPTTVSTFHKNTFSRLQGINTIARAANYGLSQPRQFKFDLVLDGNGVTESGMTTLLASVSVAQRITQFKRLCLNMAGGLHQPRFLRIQWGEGELASFDCRLETVEIEYSLFDKNGAPLHALLKTAFVEDLPAPKAVRLAGKESPDLTHVRIVKAGDTLPLLSKQIYGSAQYYLQLAEINQLDDFRKLTPGQEIIFPPLAGASGEAQP